MASLIQFFLYSIVGGISCLADCALFILFDRWVGFSSIASFILAFSLATVINYFLCLYFVFSSNRLKRGQQFLRNFLVALVGLVVSTILFTLLEYYTTSYSLMNKLLTIPATLAWNFWARRKIVFSAEMPVTILNKLNKFF